MLGNVVDAPELAVSSALTGFVRLIPACVPEFGHRVHRIPHGGVDYQQYHFTMAVSGLRVAFDYRSPARGSGVTEQFGVEVLESMPRRTLGVPCDVLAVLSREPGKLLITALSKERIKFAERSVKELRIRFLGTNLDFKHIGAGRCELVT